MKVGVVGATGAVGVAILSSLEQRKVSVAELRLFASDKSVGLSLPFRGAPVPVRALDGEEGFRGLDVVLFAASRAVAEQFVPLAVRAGAVAVDNSSFFRMDPTVPLVVPEVNAADLSSHRGVIANPNCTTAISVLALFPLHLRFGLRRVFASSYQAVSGTGQQAMAELHDQMLDIAEGKPVRPPVVYPHQIASNVIAQVDDFDEASGYTKEELKLVNEGRKIMHLPEFLASITCVRVPVMRAHSVSIIAQFERPVSLQEAREVLSNAPGVRFCPGNADFPTPLQVQGNQEVAVGRLRLDNAIENGLAMWVVGDQLLKGAAQNAVQIAELLFAKK